MYNLFIDPFLLAYPPITSNIDDFENYINSLVAWSEGINEIKEANLGIIYLSSKTSELLANINGYPDRSELEKTILKLNLEQEIQAHDIFILIDSLLKLPYIEDLLNINAILIDNIQFQPYSYLEQRNENFYQVYYELIILIFLLCESKKLKIKDQIIITRCLEAEDIQVLVKCEIVDCEFCATCDAMYNCTFPTNASVSLQCFANPNKLYEYFDPIDIWINAKGNGELYKQSVSIFMGQLNNNLSNQTALNEFSNWTFGTKFLQTAKDLGFIEDPLKVRMLLRSCSEIILKQNMADTHWLRTGKGGNNPQKKRKKDNAGAWRRDIDRDYHLHYWEIGNSIEFASVVIHNDMKIPE